MEFHPILWVISRESVSAVTVEKNIKSDKQTTGDSITAIRLFLLRPLCQPKLFPFKSLFIYFFLSDTVHNKCNQKVDILFQ